jgi:nitrite reductase/ring-hydroxylating ferredoxin subunit
MDGSLNIQGDQAAGAALDGLLRSLLASGDQPLSRATTLPPEAYTSEGFFQLEVERIFRREWLIVGHVSQCARVGDYFTLDLLGEMIVVVRAADRIRALSRICLHRWAPLVSGSGHARRFSCPFHKWAYGLDGQLLGAPLMDQVEFDPQSCRLPEYRTEIVDGFIYLNFSGDAAPLAPQLSEMTQELEDRGRDLHGVLPPHCGTSGNLRARVPGAAHVRRRWTRRLDGRSRASPGRSAGRPDSSRISRAG